MAPRIARMADKTSTAPFFANVLTFRQIARFRPYDFLDIMVVVAGEGRQISYAGSGRPRTEILRPGRMVLYRPVDEIMLTGDDEVTVRYVSFPVTEWTNFASLVGVDPSWSTAVDPPSATFDPEETAVLRPFETALDRFNSAVPTSLDLVRFWIDVIPTLFPDSHPNLPGLGAPAWLRDAVDAMRDERNLRGGLPRLLELAHVSAPHLSVTTRRYYGKTPTDLVLELRLRHAAVLLATTVDSIGSIAERSGFRTFAYFSTAFRRQHHVSPREYRARSLGRFVAVHR